MIEIKTEKVKDCEITVPGSKSYTHRILIASALSDGKCIIENGLKSEDTLFTMKGLQNLGIDIKEMDNLFIVNGAGGLFKPYDDPIDIGNSGTSIRLLTGIAALGKGVYTITGTPRMKDRPIKDLIDGLNQINIDARALNNGCPPVKVKGGNIKGGRIFLKCKVSSQYLSSLLLMAPYTQDGLEIIVTEGPVSKPYIDMTIDVMEKFGVKVTREGYERFHVMGGQVYKSRVCFVEPDCSNASYFWAAAAVSGACVKVKGITKDTIQGDIRITDVLASLGCKIIEDKSGLSIKGGDLKGIEVDMSDMPDMVPTLAVVSAFAKGTTIIKNVEHLKAKESDRLGAMVNELNKIGIDAKSTDKDLIVKGGTPKGAIIETYNDHRIAMSFAVAGLVVPGIKILDENCVEKSFPEFWQVFERLYV